MDPDDVGMCVRRAGAEGHSGDSDPEGLGPPAGGMALGIQILVSIAWMPLLAFASITRGRMAAGGI